MGTTSERLSVFASVIRAYSLPISFTSWFVAFLYSALKGGNIIFAVIALFGILSLHSATNLFDDIIDYIRAKHDIDTGKKKHFDFQKSKCFYLRNGSHNLKQYFLLLTALLVLPLFSAIYFYNVCGKEILYVIIPALILCLAYPILGCLGFGEILVAIVFSPLLYSGVHYIMNGSFSPELLFISISTGALAVAVLHNHMLLDFNCDEINGKITLCRICKTKQRALQLLGTLIMFAYINIILFICVYKSHWFYLLVFLSLPSAFVLYNVMKTHLENPEAKIKYNIFMGNVSEINKVPDEQKDFLLKFLIVRNLMNSFTFYLCIAMVLECILLRK